MLKFPTKYIVLVDRPEWRVIYYYTGWLKWFFAGFGYLFLELPGVIIGFMLGSLMETRIEYKNEDQGLVSDHGLSYMRLAYAIIRAGGEVTERKKQHAYRYISKYFGPGYLFKRIHILESIQYQHVDPIIVANQLNSSLDYPSKLHLLYFLFGIAGSREIGGRNTLRLISSIADALQIEAKDFASILAMHRPTNDRAYQILELEPTATDQEVRDAYRSLAKQHHPDKVAHLGEEYQATAKEKFQEIQHAFNEIRRHRNMSR